MSSINLSVAPRTIIGKANRRMAAGDAIPAVVYGAGREALAVSVSRHDFELFLAHHAAGSTVVELQVEGEKKPIHAMIRQMQTHPTKGMIRHVDFLAVSMNKLVHATITLHFVGDSVGVKAGGVLNVDLHELSVEAKPGNLPEGIEIDVAALEVGDSLHVRDIVAPAGVTLLDDADALVASVMAPNVEVEEVSETEVVQPQVIGEKAQDE
ncbi:MAG: 50S ribosomal protein L25 [Coriobacteriia bacterium]|nr:50S ribosomal protein L25 [Coriobacteriia bacterium]